MKVQVAKIIYNGIWIVVLDSEKKINMYTIYLKQNGHKKTMEHYGDFYSCIAFIENHIVRGAVHVLTQ